MSFRTRVIVSQHVTATCSVVSQHVAAYVGVLSTCRCNMCWCLSTYVAATCVGVQSTAVGNYALLFLPSHSYSEWPKSCKIIFKNFAQLIYKSAWLNLRYSFSLYKIIFPAKQTNMHLQQNENSIRDIDIDLEVTSSGANLTHITHGANLTHLLVHLVRIELGSNEKYSNKPIT